ncbi:hypothetical protein JQS43_09345 [Natronosporangium hydrolyticum]|uniref:Uncharacterized protein n=1 Tax=Natronosporangium hydrolyticum TaxID=2811111 RepID=A0A895YLV4_9ACTN|nr:hypothetical protein [Natronosporangium hydrolyticum]QSB16459.1 hypothetical protein JQS43_09345 [Natronosporangium hydrolyticum]
MAVRTAAEQVGRVGIRVDQLDEEVSGGHQGAVSNVAGLLHDPMVAAAEPVHRSLLLWLQAAVVGGAAIRLWAEGIEEYNRGIDRLNERYLEAKARDFDVLLPEPEFGYFPRSGPGPGPPPAILDHRAEIAEAERQLIRALGHERDYGLSPALERVARQAARLLRQGPDDPAAVRELYEAGLLPPDASLIFPVLEPAGPPPGAPPPASPPPASPPPAEVGSPPGPPTGGVAPAGPDADGGEMGGRRLVTGAISGTQPMTEDAQFEYFTNHPAEAAQATAALLPGAGALADGQETTLTALGRYHAWELQRALEMYPSPAGLERIEAATEHLAEIGERLSPGEALTEAERVYLAAWLEHVGSHGLAALPDYVQAAVAVPAGTPPADAAVIRTAQITQQLAPIADVIMHLSHPDRGGLVDPADLPTSVRELLTAPVGQIDPVTGQRWPALDPAGGGPIFAATDPPDFTVAGLARYDGLARLLEHASVEGGTLFTRSLAESAQRVQDELAEVTENVRAVLPAAEVAPALHHRLGVATADDAVVRMLAVAAREFPDPADPDSAGSDSADPDSAGPDPADPDSTGPDSAGSPTGGNGEPMIGRRITWS